MKQDKSKVLLEAFEHIDDKYLDTAGKIAEAAAPSGNWGGRLTRALPWCGAAAAAVAVCLLAVRLLSSPASPDSTIVTPGDAAGLAPFATSDTYSDLESLLRAVSGNDYHSYKQSDAEGGSRGPSVSAQSTPDDTVSFGGYTYQTDTEGGCIGIWQQTPVGAMRVGSLGQYPGGLLILGDRLVSVAAFQSGGSELDYEMSVSLELFSLADPAAPAPLQSFVLLGSLSDCYAEGNLLYLFASDGVCTCGYSRLSDTADYKPQLTCGGSECAWLDGEISILGTPANVQYTALCVIDTEAGVCREKHAFYGDVSTISHGDGWLALVTGSLREDAVYHPDIYTFDTTAALRYTGKVSCAALLSLPEGKLSGLSALSGSLPDGLYPEVLSVGRQDGQYRILGSLTSMQEGRGTVQLLAITADLSAGQGSYALFSPTGGSIPAIDEILWTDTGALMTVSSIDTADYSSHSRFVFVSFDGGIAFSESSFEIDSVSGVDGMYGYGRPYGQFDTLIGLGGGLYLRHTADSRGLDLYDLSDPAAPRCLCRCEGVIDTACRLEFDSYVYDSATVGILRVNPNAAGELRQVSYSWCIFRIYPAAAQPVTLVSEQPVTPGFDPSAAAAS